MWVKLKDKKPSVGAYAIIRIVNDGNIEAIPVCYIGDSRWRYRDSIIEGIEEWDSEYSIVRSMLKQEQSDIAIKRIIDAIDNCICSTSNDKYKVCVADITSYLCNWVDEIVRINNI